MKPTFGGNQNAIVKRVKYVGTDTIYEGMPLSYDHDTTVNVLGYDKEAGGDAENQSSPNSTAEGYQNEGKFILVENVSLANQNFFAGVVVGTSEAGKTGPIWLDIYVANGAIVPVRTDRSVSINDLAYLEPGEDDIPNVDIAGGPVIGIFEETVDRSSTAGLVLCKLTGPSLDGVDVVSARSRAVTALPTAAIWSNFNLGRLRRNPFDGSLFEADYTHGEAAPMNSYISATYAAAAEGKALTEWLKVGTEIVGNLDHFVTTDNQVVEWQVPCPITVSGGNKWGFEVRLKLSSISNTEGKLALGLMLPQVMSGDILTDAGAIIDGGFVGIHWKEADGDAIDFVYDESGQTQKEHDDDYIVPVINTYFTFGMYFNGTTIQGYVDGVSSGTAISASDISAADFPTAAILCPTLALKGAAGNDVTVSLDWIRVAQHA